MAVERWQAAGDECLGQTVRGLREVRDGAETAEALAEDAPTLHAELLSDQLGVADDRVGPEMRQVLGLLLRAHPRKRADRSRAAGAALVEEQEPVVLERPRPPGLGDELEQARRLRAGPALEEDEPRQVVVLAAGLDHLAGEDGDLLAATLLVIQGRLELVLDEDEVGRTVRRDAHRAILSVSPETCEPSPRASPSRALLQGTVPCERCYE